MSESGPGPVPPYRVGAVVYHPRVRQIWADFSAWYAERGFPLDVHYADSYDEQLETLFDGRLDTAWNTNLAHVLAVRSGGDRAAALAMRDTDLAWRSHVVVRADSDARSLADLAGRRVGFGDADSPQAHILPVHAMLAEGVDPATHFVASRLDRDLGKHGDTGGAELAQLARVRSGELDASVLSNVTWDAVGRLGDAGELRIVWTSPEFHHCTFTVLTEDDRHARFAGLLYEMDLSDPKICDAMQLEYVNRWVPADVSGYRDLAAAIEAGPVVVGSAQAIA